MTNAEILENNLEILEDSACGPAMIRTMIKVALWLQGKNPEAAPSQQEIGKEVYSWHYLVVHHHPLKFKLRDNWCLPENAHRYLHQWFDGVSVYGGEEMTVDKLTQLLDEDKAVGILFQDVLPDKSHPFGYHDNLDNGHWALAINLNEDWIELADSYRDKDGNERWFDSQGIVLADGEAEKGDGLTLEHRRIYRMRIADFVNLWWDYKFNQADGKYVHPAVAVDLNSLKA
ncbi:MAG: hypothetical protein NTZ93_01770 [Candidatus Beckwithbacteria bacterium]|nr:hypothetical protein [Candidatus Beckwithbacteria bacterium]